MNLLGFIKFFRIPFFWKFKIFEIFRILNFLGMILLEY